MGPRKVENVSRLGLLSGDSHIVWANSPFVSTMLSSTTDCSPTEQENSLEAEHASTEQVEHATTEPENITAVEHATTEPEHITAVEHASTEPENIPDKTNTTEPTEPTEQKHITAENTPTEPEHITAETIPTEPEHITAETIPTEPEHITAETIPTGPENITTTPVVTETEVTITPTNVEVEVARQQPVDTFRTLIGSTIVTVNVIPDHPTRKQLNCSCMCITPENFGIVARSCLYVDAKRKKLKKVSELLKIEIMKSRLLVARRNYGMRIDEPIEDEGVPSLCYTRTSETSTSRLARRARRSDNTAMYTPGVVKHTYEIDDNTPPSIDIGYVRPVAVDSSIKEAERRLARFNDNRVDDIWPRSSPVLQTYADLIELEPVFVNIIPSHPTAHELGIKANYNTPAIFADISTRHLIALYGERLTSAKDKLGNMLLKNKLKGDKKEWKQYVKTTMRKRSFSQDVTPTEEVLFIPSSSNTGEDTDEADTSGPTQRVGLIDRLSRLFRHCYRQRDPQ